MRQSDIEWLESIIMSSGIAKQQQRAAIVQRIKDAFDSVKYYNELQKNAKRDELSTAALLKRNTEAAKLQKKGPPNA